MTQSTNHQVLFFVDYLGLFVIIIIIIIIILSASFYIS